MKHRTLHSHVADEMFTHLPEDRAALRRIAELWDDLRCLVRKRDRGRFQAAYLELEHELGCQLLDQVEAAFSLGFEAARDPAFLLFEGERRRGMETRRVLDLDSEETLVCLVIRRERE